MPNIVVDGFELDFPAGWRFLKYDDCTYYQKHFQRLASSKAVDLVALSPQHGDLWLIEIKDYRCNRRTKAENLFVEIARKVRDTLAGLAVARVAANDLDTKTFAADAMRVGRMRIAFLLE